MSEGSNRLWHIRGVKTPGTGDWSSVDIGDVQHSIGDGKTVYLNHDAKGQLGLSSCISAATRKGADVILITRGQKRS